MAFTGKLTFEPIGCWYTVTDNGRLVKSITLSSKEYPAADACEVVIPIRNRAHLQELLDVLLEAAQFEDGK